MTDRQKVRKETKKNKTKDNVKEISMENEPVCSLSQHIGYRNILFLFHTLVLFFLSLSFLSALCAVTDFASCAQNMNILELRSLKGTMKWPEVKSYPISSFTVQKSVAEWERERLKEKESEGGESFLSDECSAVYLKVMTKLILFHWPLFLICEISGLCGSRII